MATYAFRRLLAAVPTVLAAAVLSFLLAQVLPGDAARAVLSANVPAEVVNRRRAALGLDQPLPVRFLDFLTGLAHGGLGRSAVQDRPVADIIAEALTPTTELLLLAVLISLVGAAVTGVVAARFQGRLPDHLIRIATITGISLPPFWVGLLLLQLLAVAVGAFPAGGYEAGPAAVTYLVLPAVTVAVLLGSVLTRVVRSGTLNELPRNYVSSALARGLTRRRVLANHVLRNVLNPVFALLGVSVGGLVGTAVIVENVFAVPGLGSLLVRSVALRDLPVVQGVGLILAVVVVAGNLAVDLVGALIDPRIRL